MTEQEQEQEQADVLIHKENIISRKTTNISKEYTFGKVIGSGTFGQVRLAKHKPTKKSCKNNAKIKSRPQNFSE